MEFHQKVLDFLSHELPVEPRPFLAADFVRSGGEVPDWAFRGVILNVAHPHVGAVNLLGDDYLGALFNPVAISLDVLNRGVLWEVATLSLDIPAPLTHWRLVLLATEVIGNIGAELHVCCPIRRRNQEPMTREASKPARPDTTLGLTNVSWVHGVLEVRIHAQIDSYAVRDQHVGREVDR